MGRLRHCAAVLLVVAAAAATRPATAQLPACVAAPDVNDKCETWVAQPTDVEKVEKLVTSASGDRVYAAGTDTRGRLTVTAYDTKKGTALWVGRPATNLPTGARDIVVSADGKAVYVVGTLTLRPDLNSKPFDYFLTMRFETRTGRAIWAQLYRGIGANANAATDVVLSPRGDRVYVTGWSERPGPYQVLPRDWATLAYDTKAGKQLWVTRYTGVAGGQNEPVGIGVSPRGDRVYVSGRSEHPTQSPTPVWDVATIAYSSSGRMKWSQRTPGSANAFAQRGDHVYTSAFLATGGGVVVGYDGARGSRTASIATVAPSAFAVSPDEKHVYVAGIASADAALNTVATLGIAVTEYDRGTARKGWSATYQPTGTTFAMPTALAVSGNGSSLYVLGAAGPTFSTMYPVLARISSAGALGWTARYDVREPNAPGASGALALTRNGDRVIAGGTANTVVGTGQAHGLVLGYEG
jgi:hypothetical protein